MHITQDILDHYCKAWSVTSPEYINVSSACSDVFKVTMSDGQSAALKIRYGRGIEAEENSNAALSYFDGHGIVKLYQSDVRAQLLEFVAGKMLKSYVDDGRDAEATNIICDVIEQLHSVRKTNLDVFKTLDVHACELFNQAEKRTGDEWLELAYAASLGRELLAQQVDVRALHGDVHHENIIEGARGWVLIDPNGLVGDPIYEYANTFNNPINDRDLTSDPERITMLADIIHARTGYDRTNILKYAAMHMGLSASWKLSQDLVQDARNVLRSSKQIMKLINN